MGLRQNMGIQPHKISTRLEPISWGGVPPPKWGMTMGGERPYVGLWNSKKNIENC